VVINENSPEWQSKFGMILVPGTEQPKSMIFVPLTSGYKVSGMISLQNVEREHAFSDTDVRLLETLASSMSVALENASLFDETQRLFLEAKEARTAAEQADQAKSAFLSSMSHELRTPLNAIINFVEMVARGMIGPVNHDQVELLDQALQSSKHLLNLINDVLDISKIQAGQLTLFIEDQVSVQVEVEAALSIAGGLIQEKGLQLVRDIDPHLPMVSCDRRRLRQVLLNLISNAIKFTNDGTVTMSVKNQGQEVLFAVMDTGPGIPPDKQNLIFEPFIQTENGARQLQGTGLGLPISRSLIRAHGGELWVESEGGEGSVFFFTLPVDRTSTP
jgi:signal transduction histidine kinase